MNLRNIIVSRLAIIYFALLLMSILIIGKIVAVQNIRTDRWEQIADNLTNYTFRLNLPGQYLCRRRQCAGHIVPRYYIRIDLGAPELRRFMLHKGIPLP